MRERLARIIAAAGRHLTEHVTFRQLWATIAYAITAGKAQSTQRQERIQDEVGLGSTPLELLTSGRGRGMLIEAVQRFADPARVPTPQLDEDLWEEGEPRCGDWLTDDVPEADPPATLWARGQQPAALARMASLKRLVALTHSEGEELLDLMVGVSQDMPLDYDEEELRDRVCAGIRRCYLSRDEEHAAPDWLTSGLPLWIGHTYQDIPASKRPHVAASWLPEEDLQILYPLRPAWLREPMGPVREIAWLTHPCSGRALRLDPPLLRALHQAVTSTGPLEPPERVQRLLVQLAGWFERGSEPAERVQFAVLAHPRGSLTSYGTIREDEGGARYEHG